MGATPHRWAKAASLGRPSMFSPAATSMRAALTTPIPSSASVRGGTLCQCGQLGAGPADHAAAGVPHPGHVASFNRGDLVPGTGGHNSDEATV